MRVGLFVTCLVDLMRPRIGFAALKLLETAGCEVIVPETQTCCGQPAWNSGDAPGAVALAKKTIAEFEGFDYVVAPSGSCGDHIRTEYPTLLGEEPELREALKAYSNWPTYPQLYVQGELVGGCDIVLEMFRSGELQKLLDEAGATQA